MIFLNKIVQHYPHITNLWNMLNFLYIVSVFLLIVEKFLND